MTTYFENSTKVFLRRKTDVKHYIKWFQKASIYAASYPNNKSHVPVGQNKRQIAIKQNATKQEWLRSTLRNKDNFPLQDSAKKNFVCNAKQAYDMA